MGQTNTRQKIQQTSQMVQQKRYNELINKGFREQDEPIFDQEIYDGQRPTIGSKKPNFFQEIPQEIYKSTITLEINTGKINQPLFKHKQDRIKIKNTLEYPYCSIGLLSMDYDQYVATGSAALIAGNHILTCAHNVYNKQSKKQAGQIVFYPACNGKRTFGQGKKVIRRFIMEEYKTCKQQEAFMFDYAILEIQDDIAQKFGYFGIDFTESNYKNKQVTVCGYSGDKQGNQQKTMWEAKGQIKQIQKGQLYYDIPTYAGQSGSPIFIQQGENYYIVGIHTHGDHDRQMNGGKLIQNVLHDNFKKWLVKKTGILNLNNIQNLDSNQMGDSGVKYLTSREWQGIKELDLGLNGIGDQGMKHLASRQWSELKQLNLWNNHIGAQGIKYFASREWSRLNKLNLNYNKYGHQGIKYFASREWPALKQLYLQGNQIGAKGMEYLASREWPALNRLNLDCNKIGAKGVEYFASREWKGLKELNIEQNQIGDQGMKNLSSREWPGLNRLNLDCNRIGAKGVEYLASREWKGLKELNIEQNQIDAQGMKYLASREWPGLNKLNLYCNKIGAKGVEYLASREWPSLAKLNLEGNHIGAQGIKNLASREWPRLIKLNLVRNKIGAQGIKYLTSRDWPGLEILNLVYNWIGDQGLEYLASRQWQGLKELALYDNAIDEQKLKQFKFKMQKLAPQLQIYF